MPFSSMRTLAVVVMLAVLCYLSDSSFAQSTNAGHSSVRGASIQIVRRSSAPYTVTGDLPLLNSLGEIVGLMQWEPTDQGRQLLIVPVSGTPFLITPLDETVISADGDRVITYGDRLGRHVIKNLSVDIYSGTGDAVRSIETDIWALYVVAISSNGEIWIAGQQQADTVRTVIAKYGRDGDRLWQRGVPAASPAQIVLSPSSDVAAVVLRDEERGQRIAHFVDNQGELFRTFHLPRFHYGVEFITDHMFVVYSGHNWELHRVNGDDSLIASGDLSGNPLGAHPVTGNPDQGFFTVVTMGGKEPDSGYRLHVFDIESGDLLAQHLFEGTPFWQGCRMARVTDDGNLELIVNDELIEVDVRR